MAVAFTNLHPHTPEPEAQQDSAKAPNSYGEILKSSALIGGAQVVNIGIRIVRTKAMAMLLGPAGFGLAGLYSSIIDLSANVAGLGVNSSGVRQIAEAVGSDNNDRIALTVAILRRTAVVLGVIGALGLVMFRRQLSVLTFGTPKYATGVAMLSLALFCTLVSGGQGALIQGMRRIGDLAKMNVLGSGFGAIAGVVLIYFFRENGIVPYLVAVSAMATLMSWWYSRNIRIAAPPVDLSQIVHEARALLKLGCAFMVSSMMTLGVAYAIRVIVLHRVGIEGTGLYQSAWSFGGMYVGFILQAMGADFYPRLTAHIHDHKVCNRLVNEQARVGLLLAGPGVIATLTFAPVVIALLYSAKFAGSVPILRWVCLGTLLQVITWPMGFIIVAKGKQNLFIFSEVAWAVVSLALAWSCMLYFGLTGAGISFFGSYVFHAILVYPIARHLSGFRWSAENLKTGALFLGIIAGVFCSLYLLPLFLAALLGTVAAVGTGIYSARVITSIVPEHELPRPLRGLLTFFRQPTAEEIRSAN